MIGLPLAARLYIREKERPKLPAGTRSTFKTKLVQAGELLERACLSGTYDEDKSGSRSTGRMPNGRFSGRRSPSGLAGPQVRREPHQPGEAGCPQERLADRTVRTLR
jgi:hypothetical protein